MCVEKVEHTYLYAAHEKCSALGCYLHLQLSKYSNIFVLPCITTKCYDIGVKSVKKKHSLKV